MAEGMTPPKKKGAWLVGGVLLLVVLGGLALARAIRTEPATERRAAGFVGSARPHFDHAPGHHRPRSRPPRP